MGQGSKTQVMKNKLSNGNLLIVQEVTQKILLKISFHLSAIRKKLTILSQKIEKFSGEDIPAPGRNLIPRGDLEVSRHRAGRCDPLSTYKHLSV